MMLSRKLYASKEVRATLFVGLAFIALVSPLRAQRYEITPLFGARMGGTRDVQPDDRPLDQTRARLSDSAVYGIAAGVRFDEEECEGCSLVEFRWMRQNTKLGFAETTVVPGSLSAFGRTSVTLDHYMADFTHEWVLPEAKAVRPFVMASLGASRLSTGISGKTRFSFGLGAGVKVFPHPRWGIRFHAEYLPTVMHSDVQRFACVSASCGVVLTGGLLNQFEVAVGPIFRF